MAVDKRAVEEALLKEWLGEEGYNRVVAIHGHKTVVKAFARANSAISGGFSPKRVLLLALIQLIARWRIRFERFQTWLEAE